MWFFTVFSEMNSFPAMSRLFSPWATSRSTSISRSVSLGAGICGFWSEDLLMAANSVSSLLAIDGLIRDCPPIPNGSRRRPPRSGSPSAGNRRRPP